ncbi:hypothetical protein [Planococcus sp. ISL-110]|uniref:hypothetical protein n=1 Tax=Planococcus sp. ISL-110 TaxID=2819167 RepID=UPI001BEB6425|nr:hypothetical protein [Planococcus sp. ISL-110]MBT2572081.1 hypothetical protein [Planococcus sp. ISL-110]
MEGIEIGFFDTAKNWSIDNYANYYRYFSHSDRDIRKYSLLVFAAALGNWWMKSAFVFLTLGEIEEKQDFQSELYLLEDYVQAFLKNKEAIQREFPLLYNSILVDLIHLDNEKCFENTFPAANKKIFSELRKTLKNSDIDEKYQYNFNDLLREVGLPTFLKD